MICLMIHVPEIWKIVCVIFSFIDRLFYIFINFYACFKLMNASRVMSLLKNKKMWKRIIILKLVLVDWSYDVHFILEVNRHTYYEKKIH